MEPRLVYKYTVYWHMDSEGNRIEDPPPDKTQVQDERLETSYVDALIDSDKDE